MVQQHYTHTNARTVSVCLFGLHQGLRLTVTGDCSCLVVITPCSQKPVSISAHRLLIVARSPVFAAMFCGDLAEQTQNPVIAIDDVEPGAFKQMLR